MKMKKKEEKIRKHERKNYQAMGANKNEKLYSFVCSAKFCIILTRYQSKNKQKRDSSLDTIQFKAKKSEMMIYKIDQSLSLFGNILSLLSELLRTCVQVLINPYKGISLQKLALSV